jgi:hypothetical protein
MTTGVEPIGFMGGFGWFWEDIRDNLMHDGDAERQIGAKPFIFGPFLPCFALTPCRLQL